MDKGQHGLQRRRARPGAGLAKVLAGVLAGLLTACGGGGGGGGGTDPGAMDGPRPPQATVVRDENPTAARLDVGPADFFPAGTVVLSLFDRLDDAGQ